MLESFVANHKVEIECAIDILDIDIVTSVSLGLIVIELLTKQLNESMREDSQNGIRTILEFKSPAAA